MFLFGKYLGFPPQEGTPFFKMSAQLFTFPIWTWTVIVFSVLFKSFLPARVPSLHCCLSISSSFPLWFSVLVLDRSWQLLRLLNSFAQGVGGDASYGKIFSVLWQLFGSLWTVFIYTFAVFFNKLAKVPHPYPPPFLPPQRLSCCSPQEWTLSSRSTPNDKLITQPQFWVLRGFQHRSAIIR